MKITIVKKAATKFSDTRNCPWVVEALPEPKK
jgi:hypothetical protein